MEKNNKEQYYLDIKKDLENISKILDLQIKIINGIKELIKNQIDNKKI